MFPAQGRGVGYGVLGKEEAEGGEAVDEGDEDDAAGGDDGFGGGVVAVVGTAFEQAGEVVAEPGRSDLRAWRAKGAIVHPPAICYKVPEA